MEPATIDVLAAILTIGIMAATIWWITPQPIKTALRFLIRGARVMLRWCWFIIKLPFFPMTLWWYFQQEKPKFVLLTTIAMLKTLGTLVLINPLLIVGTLCALLVQLVAFLVSLILGKAAMRYTSGWLFWSMITLRRLVLAYVPPFLRNLFGSSNIVRHLGGLYHMQRHLYIVGASGKGKSTLIKNLIWHFLKKRYGFLLVEPHGELTKEVLYLQSFKKNHKNRARERLVVLDLESDNPTPFNIFNVALPRAPDARNKYIDNLVQAYLSAFQTTFENLGQALTGGMSVILENLTHLALDVSHKQILTLEDFAKMLTPVAHLDERYTRLFSQVSNPLVKHYFATTFMSAGINKSRDELRNRLTRLVRNHACRKSFGCLENTIDFKDIYDKGKILIVKASKGEVGEWTCAFAGVFVNTLMYHYAFQRLSSSKKRIPFFVILDECHNYVTDPKLVRGMKELRKTDTHYVLAHQELYQDNITPKQQKAFKSLNIKICGKLVDADAQEMARELGMDDKGETIKKLDIGEFVIKVGEYRAQWVKMNARFALKHEKVGKVRHSIYMRDAERAELDRYLAARQRGAPARPKPKEKPQTTKEQKQHVSKRANTTTYTVDHFEL